MQHIFILRRFWRINQKVKKNWIFCQVSCISTLHGRRPNYLLIYVYINMNFFVRRYFLNWLLKPSISTLLNIYIYIYIYVCVCVFYFIAVQSQSKFCSTDIRDFDKVIITPMCACNGTWYLLSNKWITTKQFFRRICFNEIDRGYSNYNDLIWWLPDDIDHCNW